MRLKEAAMVDGGRDADVTFYQKQQVYPVQSSTDGDHFSGVARTTLVQALQADNGRSADVRAPYAPAFRLGKVWLANLESAIL